MGWGQWSVGYDEGQTHQRRFFRGGGTTFSNSHPACQTQFSARRIWTVPESRSNPGYFQPVRELLNVYMSIRLLCQDMKIIQWEEFTT